MQLFEYALNIVCAPYSQNFFLHLFLGDVPANLDYEHPTSAPSWIGQEYVMPQLTGRGAGVQSYGADIPTYGSSWAPYQSAGYFTSNVPLGTSTADALPQDFLKGAVYSTRPLNTPLVSHMRRSGPADLPPDEVCPYLASHLNWRAVSLTNLEIPIRKIPLRVYVTRTQIVQDRNGQRNYGHSEILWDSTHAKPGGLEQGELPQLER